MSTVQGHDLFLLQDISSSPLVPRHMDYKSARPPPRPSRGNGLSSPKETRMPSPDLSDDMLHRDTSSSATSETISHVSSVEESKKDSSIMIKMPQAEVKDIVIQNPELLDKRDIFSTSPKSSGGDGKKKKKSATLPKTRSISKKDSTSHHSSLIETFGSITRKFRGFTESNHQGSPKGLRYECLVQ